MKGILFTPENIKAIAESGKTQTRRLMTHYAVPSTDIVSFKEIQSVEDSTDIPDGYYAIMRCNANQDNGDIYFRSRYLPGEMVYIKEAYCHKVDPITAVVSDSEFYYKADGFEVERVDGDGAPEFNKDGSQKSPWLSPLFMPQSAARYFLTIKDVRPERLQEITEEDAIAEGCPSREQTGCDTARYRYHYLWDSINKKLGTRWADNPFVWVYTFTLAKPEGR